MSSSCVTYEQPMTELMRVMLHLERFFHKYQSFSSSPGYQNSKIALESLLKIADIADRPNLKLMLLQTINRRACALMQLEQHPDIDLNKLSQIKNSLHALTKTLNQTGAKKLGDQIRKNPFLKSIRLQLSNPAGICDFNVPAYTLWLAQPHKQKAADLGLWHQQLEPIEQAIKLILKLTRESATTERILAHDFYHRTLDSSLPCQMLQIHIPNNKKLYPEISVSKHRLAIRFKTLNLGDHHITPNNQITLNFRLSYCGV